jgi:hypothetical protein
MTPPTEQTPDIHRGTVGSEAKRILAFRPERFTTLISHEFEEERGSQAVAEYIKEVSDTSAVPWHVLPEFEAMTLADLRAGADDGEDVLYRLVELQLETLEERSEAGYGWVNTEKVCEYVRRCHPPPLVFAEADGRVFILDGSHRPKAALTRGDRSVRAWVPASVCPSSQQRTAPQ